MAILGCNFNINFDQTLAPGSSLCNTLRTKLHAWTESSIIVEFMVKFIWQHNLPVGSYHTFKMPPGRLDFWCSKGKKWDPPCNSKTKSQRSEPKWLLKYLITPNFCAKFQPNRLTTTFGPWNTFSDNDTVQCHCYNAIIPWPPSLIFSPRKIGESRNDNSLGRHWDEIQKWERGRTPWVTPTPRLFFRIQHCGYASGKHSRTWRKFFDMICFVSLWANCCFMCSLKSK